MGCCAAWAECWERPSQAPPSALHAEPDIQGAGRRARRIAPALPAVRRRGDDSAWRALTTVARLRSPAARAPRAHDAARPHTVRVKAKRPVTESAHACMPQRGTRERHAVVHVHAHPAPPALPFALLVPLQAYFNTPAQRCAKPPLVSQAVRVCARAAIATSAVQHHAEAHSGHPHQWVIH